MTIRRHSNNAATQLAVSLTASATSMQVVSSAGFPTLSGGDEFRVTLFNNGIREIVIVTAVTGNIWTITRAAEGTIANVFLSGSAVELRDTADSYDRKQDLIDNQTLTTVTPASSDVVLVKDASDSYKLKGVLFSSFGGGGGGGTGDVVGPASANANMPVFFDGTTGKLIKSTLADPNADRILFWDDSAGAFDFLTAGTGLTITGTTISATGGGGGSGIASVSADPSPSLGGDLNVGNYYITNTSTSNGIRLKTVSSIELANDGSVKVMSNSGSDNAHLRIYKYDGSSYVDFTVSNSLSGSNSYRLPPALPGSGTQYLGCTSSGSMDWYTINAGIPDGTYNDITVSSSGTVLTINSPSVALAADDEILVKDTSNSSKTSRVSADSIAKYATMVGTLTSGIWNATTIATLYGGTGQSTYTNGQLLIGNTSSNSLSKATISSTNNITVTNGPGTISIGKRTGGIYINTNSSISVPTATYTLVPLNNKVRDTNNDFNSSIYRHQPTVAGTYLYYGATGINTGTTACQVQSGIYKNGGVEVLNVNNATATGFITVPVTAILEMNGTTDYVELYCYHLAGVAKPLVGIATCNYLQGVLI